MSLFKKITRTLMGKPLAEDTSPAPFEDGQAGSDSTGQEAGEQGEDRPRGRNRNRNRNRNRGRRGNQGEKREDGRSRPRRNPVKNKKAAAGGDRAGEPGTPPLRVVRAVDPVGFKDLGLREEILRAVGEQGYENPTPVQQASIADLAKGRDLLGCAQTGTGKTAAFALPTLQRLSTGSAVGGLRALILTPTRELALQVAESYEHYGRHLSLSTGVIYGGVSERPQISALKRGMDILVATPGRLLDLHGQGYIDFGDLEILVLDEADRMLDMGFLRTVKQILRLLPARRQNVLFSATMPRDIQDLSMGLLHDPVRVEVAPVSSTSEQVEQCVYFVDRPDKRRLLLHLLEDPAMDKVLVFTRTKAIANRISKFLGDRDIVAEAIHGNKSQNARQKAPANFKEGRTRVLVASDLAARGLDVDDISHVVNYDLPNVPETYVHRIGRTGRAAAEGRAVSFCDQEERPWLKEIEKLTGKTVPVIDDHPFPPDPDRPAPAPAARGGGSGQRRGGGGGRNRGRGRRGRSR